MKVGLFGGTFNPIHFGHLRSAEEVRLQYRLDRVVFIPSGMPPHKKSEELAPAEDRCEMVRIATEGNPHFETSDIEIRKGGRSFTIETLRQSREYFPNDTLFFIVGSEAFQEISTWREYEKLFELANFIVMAREPLPKRRLNTILPVEIADQFCYSKKLKGFQHRSQNWVYWASITHLEISSTQIRELTSRGESIRYLVPQAVERYIDLKGLYK